MTTTAPVHFPSRRFGQPFPLFLSRAVLAPIAFLSLLGSVSTAASSPTDAAEEGAAGTKTALRLRCPERSVERAFRLAIEVAEGNIHPWRGGLLERPVPTLMAGASYGRPWTRDASYNTWFAAALLWPDVARNTLRGVVERDPAGGRPRVAGQYWDSMAWATGAWGFFEVTGDERFLAFAYPVVVDSLARLDERELDRATGLYRGPGWSDGVAGYPPPWCEAGGSSFILDHARRAAGSKGIDMKALSTNCLYAEAWRIAARMAHRLSRPESEAEAHQARATALGAAINRELWLEEKGHYAYFIEPDGHRDPHQEALGHAFALLFRIAGERRAARVLRAQHLDPAGVPCVWPLFERFRGSVGRHCGTVWPQIQAFWGLAAAERGRPDLLVRELAALTRCALGSGDFREIYHPVTGKPCGGLQIGRRWRSQPGQSWAATGWLAMLLRGVVGLWFEPDELRLTPRLPGRLSPLRLEGLRWRGATLDIELRGAGTRVEELRVDGEPRAAPLRLGAKLAGRHRIDARLGGPGLRWP